MVQFKFNPLTNEFDEVESVGPAGAAVKQLNGSSGTIFISAGNNISISNNLHTIQVHNLLSSGQAVQDVGSVTAGGTNASLFAKDDHVHRGVGQLQIGGNTVNDSSPRYGSVMIAGGNNVTLSQQGQTITISGPNAVAQSTAPSAIVASDATFTSGTVVVSGGNNVTVGSAAGQKIVISAQSQSVQPAVAELNGSSGSLTIVAGANITVSNTGSSISIIGPSVPAQSVQSYDIIAAGSQTAQTSGTVVFSNSNNVSFGMSNSSVVTASASFSQSVQPAVVQLNGSSGTLTIVAGANITVSNTGSSISIIGAAGGGSGIGGIQDSGTSIATSGTVQFANSNNVTFGLSGQTMTASIPGQSTQPAVGSLNGSSGTLTIVAGTNITVSNTGSSISIIGPNVPAQSVQSYDIIAAGSQTAQTSGTVMFSNSNNVSFGMSNSSVVTATATFAQSTQPAVGQLNGSSGTLTIVAGTNITVSNTGSSISIIGPNVPAQSVQSYDIIAAGSQTALTTGTVVFSNSNNVSFGMSNSSVVTATATFAQSTQPAVGSLNGSSGTLTIVAGSNITVSNTGSSISIIGPDQSIQTQGLVQQIAIFGATSGCQGFVELDPGGYVQLQQAGNSITIDVDNIWYNIISAGTQSAHTTGLVVLSNSNNVSFGMENSSVVTASASFAQSVQPAVGSLNGSSGTLTIVAGSNITVSNTGSSISIIGPNVPGQSVQSYDIIAAGSQTAQTTGTVVFSNSNNVSFGMSNSSIVTASASWAQSTAPGGIEAGTQTAVSGTVVFSNSNNVSFGMTNTSVVTATATFAQSTQSYNIPAAGAQTGNTSGTCVFSNSNNVSFGMTNNSIITASASWTQSTGPSAIVASDATFASGSVVISGSANITVGSAAGQKVMLSVAAQSVQPDVGSLNASSGTISISAGSAMSVSNNNSTIILHNLGVQSLNGSTGTLTIVAGTNITVSNQGSSISIIGAGGAAGSNTIGMSNLGNTSGTTGAVSGSAIRYHLAGGNNITLSQSLDAGHVSGTVTISGFCYSDTVAALGNAAAAPFYFFLSNGNTNITLSTATGLVGGSANGLSVSIYGPTPAAGIGGIKGSGASIATSGTVVFSNSNFISFGLNGQTMTAGYAGDMIGAASLAFVSPFQYVFAAGNTNITLTQSTTVLGGTLNCATLYITGPTPGSAQSTQPAVGSLNGYSGTLTISAGSAISVSNNASTIMLHNIGVQSLDGITGTVTLVAGNMISISNSSKSISIINLFTTGTNIQDIGTATNAGASASAIARVDHVHRGVALVSMVGNTSNSNTYGIGSVVLSGGANITLSNVTFPGGASIGIVGAAGGVGIGGIAGSNATTATSGTVQFVGSNNVTFGLTNNSQITASASYSKEPANVIAAGAQTANTSGTVVFSNSNNVSFGMTNSSQITASAAFSGVGASNATITAGAVIFANSSATSNNFCSFGMNGSTITGIVNVDVIGMSSGASNTKVLSPFNCFIVPGNTNISMSASSATPGGTPYSNLTISIYGPTPGAVIAAGAQTGNTSGTMVFSNSNNVSFGMQNNSIVTASASYTKEPANVIAAGAQTANTSGTVVFSNSNNVSFGMSNNSVITASATFAGGGTVRAFYPYPQEMQAYSTISTLQGYFLSLYPWFLDVSLTATRADFIMSFSWGAESAAYVTQVGSLSLGAYIYTDNAGTLSSLTSGSTNHSWSFIAQNTAYTSVFSNVSGAKALSIPLNLNLSPRQYYIGFWYALSNVISDAWNGSTLTYTAMPCSTGLNTLTCLAGSWIGVPLLLNPIFSGPFNSASNSSHRWVPWYGVHGTSFANWAAVPGTISASQIVRTLSNPVPIIVFRNT